MWYSAGINEKGRFESVYCILLGILCILLPPAGWWIGIKWELYRYRNIVLGAMTFAFVPVGVMLLCLHTDDRLLSALSTFPNAFVRWAVIPIVLLTVLMIVSNAFLVNREGLRSGNIIGTVLGLAFTAASAVIWIVNSLSLSPGLSMLRMVLVCLLGYGECMVFGMISMGILAAGHKPAFDKDYIIILGCSISKTGGLLPLLKGRTNRAIRFAWDQEKAVSRPVRYVPSGGQGADEIMSEGSAMELYLLSHGAESYEVFPERKSRNTEENFSLSAEIIRSLNPDAGIAFSTTGYHVLRAGILASHLGLRVEGIASRTRWYFYLNAFAREIIALYVMGKKSHILCFAFLAALCILSVTVI